jgi:asparagine synthetase B (glutamine-hydrolysing)
VLCSGTAHDPERTGGSDVEKLDGQFVWARYDASRRELQVANDPFGMRSLYVAERGGAVYLSTCSLALAAHLGAQPNLRGVNSFLRTGYQFGTLTMWDGIERLEPGTRIRFTAHGTRREIYWAPSVDESVAALDLDAATEHCLRVAHETLTSYYPAGTPRAWADLTGGWDSRLATTLLEDARVDFVTNTAGDAGSADVRVAERVARVAGWDWQRFAIPDDWRELMPPLVSLAIGWGDGDLDALQLAEVLWGHLAKARAHSKLLTGGGGEHFRDRAWQQEFFKGGRSRSINYDNYVDMRMLKPLDTSVFAHDPTREVREELRARMRARAAPYSSHLNTTQLDMIAVYKFTGHFGAYLSASVGSIAVDMPYFFKPIFTAAVSTNHRHRSSHRLMRRMLQALNPAVAAVETEAGGPATPMTIRSSYRFAPYYATLARRAVRKIGQRVLSRPVLPAPTPSNAARASAHHAFVATLDDGRALRHEAMRSAPLYLRDPLNALLARAGDPALGGRAALLSRVLTVELALRAVDAAIDEAPRFVRRGRAGALASAQAESAPSTVPG